MPTVELVTPIPGPRSVALQEQRLRLLPAGLSSVLPVFIDRAEGCALIDVDGNRLLDFTGGIGSQNAGHCPPAAVGAIQRQAAKLLHTCFTATPYEGYLKVAEWLNANTPGSFEKRTFLVNSGAEAVENAIKIARHYTGRNAVVAFEDAFHGRTQLALSLTGKTHPYKSGFGPFAPEVYRIPYAYCYRCPYNLTYPSCGLTCAHALETTFLRQVEAKAVAAIIVEPILGEGGFITPPTDWFAVIRQICDKYGIVLIADEIQTGFCRTGSVFACHKFGVTPDLILSGKSIAGGLPLAAVTGKAEIMDSPDPGGLGGTFGGNPVSCAAAEQVFDLLQELGLEKRANQIGELFRSVTAKWISQYRLIGDLRGEGAMRAIELVTDRNTKEPASRETKQILSLCHQRGLLIISAGVFNNVIRMLVPLVATNEQIEEGLQILESAIADVI